MGNALDAYLRDVEARCAQATPGPWESPLRDLGRVESFKAVDFYFDESYEAYPPLGEAGPVFVTPTRGNADLLVHARTDLPLLLQLVRWQQEALEEQRRQMAYPDLPPAFAETMVRMIDATLARIEQAVREKEKEKA